MKQGRVLLCIAFISCIAGSTYSGEIPSKDTLYTFPKISYVFNFRLGTGRYWKNSSPVFGDSTRGGISLFGIGGGVKKDKFSLLLKWDWTGLWSKITFDNEKETTLKAKHDFHDLKLEGRFNLLRYSYFQTGISVALQHYYFKGYLEREERETGIKKIYVDRSWGRWGPEIGTDLRFILNVRREKNSGGFVFIECDESWFFGEENENKCEIKIGAGGAERTATNHYLGGDFYLFFRRYYGKAFKSWYFGLGGSFITAK
ncbi:MAG: hypothetical protein AB1393_12245 [Candidatus Edwardsbacteria bacterium]